MSRYRDDLPQRASGRFLTDSGLETTLLFLEGLELPCFAAFPLLDREDGIRLLERYFREHARLATESGFGFIFESPTWRASTDWGRQLGYSAQDLDRVNRRSIGLLRGLRDELEQPGQPMIVSGCLGPRGDGYNPRSFMTASEAEDYHGPQIASFEAAGADMVTAMTITYVAEAIGIVRAAEAAGMPVAISFTTETTGWLPSGQPLGEAIGQIDDITSSQVAYFMINCAHPDHFSSAIPVGALWTSRVLGVRANASRLSHAELDEATELDAGDPAELARDYEALTALLPNLRIFGGCCGTDRRHIEAIARGLQLRATA